MQNYVRLSNIDWDKLWGKPKLSKHLSNNKYNYSGALYLPVVIKVQDTEHD